ncbi:MAG: amidase [Candidatus Aquirickettsiella gammari]
MQSRRQFLIKTPIGLLGATAGLSAAAEQVAQQSATPASTVGTPPTFGTAPAVGPEVTATTFAEAEKLMRVSLTPAEREMAANTWRVTMAGLTERRTGPRQLALPDNVAPATVWNPVLPGTKLKVTQNQFVRSKAKPDPLPKNDTDIAFSPVTRLARWIESKAITSERLTRIYLDRIERLDPRLRSVITLTKEQALQQARQADKEIAVGKYRGPLHGIPYGVKDLLDTAGIPTTYGAEPFRERIPAYDSVVVARLHAAGAVLIAKLSLGALALNDVWFGGQTMNPWLLEEGASGSSAGPGAATAAALVAFSIGSETGGSIIGPSMRCGVTGLRPTFGRVPRTGAMTLSWSLDKLGPMTRTVEDAMLVLQAISAYDSGDQSSVHSHLEFHAGAPVKGLKFGYVPTWMQEATEVDRVAFESLRAQGMIPTPISLPNWPYESLNLILFAEAAAAFEDIVLNGKINMLKMQVPDAWPNIFREARFLSAVDLIQAERLRRQVAQEMARIFSTVDFLLVPSLRDEMLTISNHTGHPSLTVRTGTVKITEARSDWAPNPQKPVPQFAPARTVPHGVTLIGRLFDEGTIARVGMALENAAGVVTHRPVGFD